MFGLGQLQGLLIGIGIALIVGFSTGFYTKAQFIKANQTDIAIAVNKANIKAVDTTMKKEAVLTDKLVKQEEKVRIIRKEVIKYVPAPVQEARGPAPNPHFGADRSGNPTMGEVPVGEGGLLAANQPMGVCPSDYLSNGAVSLLNDARAGGSVLAPALDPATASAPSAIDQRAFVDNDLEVVGKCTALATRYNELLDYIEDYKKRQRERLSIK